MIAIKHFREVIVRPALDALKLYSVAAEELLVITCAQESLGGTYLMQNDPKGYPVGPAIGPYQQERASYDDLWANFLLYHPLWIGRLTLAGLPVAGKPDADVMAFEWRYATQIARLLYYRYPEPIPDDLEGQMKLYKKRWNTELGAATLADVRRNYERFTGTGR